MKTGVSKEQCCQLEFLEWPVTFLSQRGMHDRDQGVGGPSLKTSNKGTGSKLRKNSSLKISKSEFWLIKVLLYSSKSQDFCGIILLQKRSSWF